jgi:hypothetical protein
MKEGKQAVAMTRFTYHRLRANEARLWVSLIAYNLGNLSRRLSRPAVSPAAKLTNLDSPNLRGAWKEH